MWRIGIIGAGDYGAQHAQAIAELENVEIVAASRTNASALAEFTQRYGGTGYADYRGLLADPNVDAVVIATPHHLHRETTVQAAQAGKHILLEKPMADSLEECRIIAQAVNEAGVKFMVGHVNRFAPAYHSAKQILLSGEMGEVVMGTATMQKFWFEPNRREWHLNRETGGGVWLTVGIHPLDRLIWLIDSPVVSVSAQFSTRFHEQNADDAGMVFLRHANGAAGCVVSVGYADGAPKHLTELVCTKGMMNIDYTEGVKIGRGENWHSVPESIPTGNWMHASLVEEWRQFVHALDTDGQTPVPAQAALHVMEVAFAAEESAHTQSEIKISPAQ